MAQHTPYPYSISIYIYIYMFVLYVIVFPVLIAHMLTFHTYFCLQIIKYGLRALNFLKEL